MRAGQVFRLSFPTENSSNVGKTELLLRASGLMGVLENGDIGCFCSTLFWVRTDQVLPTDATFSGYTEPNFPTLRYPKHCANNNEHVCQRLVFGVEICKAAMNSVIH